MKFRAVALSAALLSASVAAPAALAAKKPAPKPVKPSCNVVTDPSGDESLAGAVPGNANDDILSADVASDGKTLTAVVRMAGMDASDPMAPMGRNYLVQLDATGADTTLFLAAKTFPTGTVYSYGYSGVNVVVNTSYTQGSATGFIDAAKKEVHISVPVTVFAGHGAKFLKGSKVTPTITVYRMIGQGVVPSQQVGPVWAPVGGLSEAFDNASALKAYVVGTPSCVTPGK